MYASSGTPSTSGSQCPVGAAQVATCSAPDGQPPPAGGYGKPATPPFDYEAQTFQFAYKKQIKEYAKKAKEVNQARQTVPAETVGYLGPQGTWGLELLDGEVEIFSTVVVKEELVAGDYAFCGDGMYCCLTKPKRQMVSSICDRFVVMVTNRRVVVREEDYREREGWDKAAHMSKFFRFLVYYPALLFLCYGPSTFGKGKGTKKVIKERQYMVADLKDVQYSFEETEVDLEVHRKGGLLCGRAGLVDEGEVELPPTCFSGCVAQRKKVQEKEMRVELHLQFVKKTADYQGAHWKWFQGVGASVATEVIKGLVLRKEDGHALRRALMMHPTRLQQAGATDTCCAAPGGCAGAGSTHLTVKASGACEHKVGVPATALPSPGEVLGSIWSSVAPLASKANKWGEKVLGMRQAKLNRRFFDGAITGNEVRIEGGEAKLWAHLEVDKPPPPPSSPVDAE